MLFDGIPVFLEWSIRFKLYQLVTLKLEPKWHYKNYDINWCDEKRCYYMEENGEPTLPYLLSNKKNAAGDISSYYYWAAPHFPLLFERDLVLSFCQRIAIVDILPLLFSNATIKKAFIADHPELFIHHKTVFNGPWFQSFLNTWADSGFVVPGRIIECPLCKVTYDYETEHPCMHLNWCSFCECWSVPPVYGQEDCYHRTPDGLYYAPPQK